MSECNLVGVQSEDLRLGEAALDLDREHGLLHLALPVAVGGKEQVARELHGQRGRALDFASGFDVTVGSADDAPEVYPGVTVEIFVFDRDQRVAEHRREIVVAHDDSSLQRERADDFSVIIIEFSDRAGPIGFERVHLGQVGGVYEQQATGGADQNRDQDQQAKQDAAYELAPADFHLGEVFVKNLHGALSQDSTWRNRRLWTWMGRAARRRPDSRRGRRRYGFATGSGTTDSSSFALATRHRKIAEPR